MVRSARIEVGTSRVNPSDLKGLRLAWQHRRLVALLGAGVSFDYGVPGWRDLVLRLLFRQTDAARRLEPLHPRIRRALTGWLVDQLGYDPVVLARVIRNDIRTRARRAGAADAAGQAFLERVREQIYGGLREPPTPTTLTAVADLVEATREHTGLAAVVTLNFDDLLERELALRAAAGRLLVRPAPIWQGRRVRGDVFPIVHPHGYLPRDPAGGGAAIVFTEEDYHALSATVFHWALSELVGYLRHYHVLFIGVSMSDPNLRRLLDASYERGDIPAHWQVQRRHTVGDAHLGTAVADIEGRFRRDGDAGEDDPAPAPAEIAEVIRAALRQADSYDRAMFETMGVKTIRVESFADIPPLLDAIRA